MTLQELGKEYIKSSEEIIKKIQILNKEAKRLEGNRLLEMKRRIYSLYADSSELRQTAYRLKNYYREDTKNG